MPCRSVPTETCRRQMVWLLSLTPVDPPKLTKYSVRPLCHGRLEKPSLEGSRYNGISGFGSPTTLELTHPYPTHHASLGLLTLELVVVRCTSEESSLVFHRRAAGEGVELKFIETIGRNLEGRIALYDFYSIERNAEGWALMPGLWSKEEILGADAMEGRSS